MQGFCVCTNLKILVRIKDAFFLHFAKFCVLNFWNACFCSSIAFWLVRDFRPDFWAVSDLEAIWSFFAVYASFSFSCPIFSS